jgi:hypothetical protein
VTDTLNSIFQKYCPKCGASGPKDALRCSCGHSFEFNQAQVALSQTLADEKLYEDYLAARLKQASQELIEAETMHKADRKDSNKTAKVARALEAAETIRKELNVQITKIAQLAKSLQTGIAEKSVEAGRTRLTKEAERAVQKASARRVKTCPRCKIAVPGDIVRCRCGFAFPEERAGIPPLTSGPGNPTASNRPKRS